MLKPPCPPRRSARSNRSNKGLAAKGSAPAAAARSSVTTGARKAWVKANETASRCCCKSGSLRAWACVSLNSAGSLYAGPKVCASAPGKTMAANGRSIARAKGVTTTCASSPEAGTNCSASNASSTQAMNSEKGTTVSRSTCSCALPGQGDREIHNAPSIFSPASCFSKAVSPHTARSAADSAAIQSLRLRRDGP